MAENNLIAQVISETVVPSSASAPAPASTPAPSRTVATIEFAPPSAAEDEHLVTKLTNIVNVAYSTEGDFFVEGYERIVPDGIRKIIRDGELAVAYINAPDSERKPIGCIRIVGLSDTKGEFGMLAMDRAYLGGGAGRDLVLFAEEHFRRLGKTTMQLELLVPTWFEHKFKKRLHEWYSRMAYEMVRVENLKDHYPNLVPLLKGPCDYRVYEKKLI